MYLISFQTNFFLQGLLGSPHRPRVRTGEVPEASRPPLTSKLNPSPLAPPEEGWVSGKRGWGPGLQAPSPPAPGTIEKKEGSREPYASLLQARDPLLTSFSSTLGPGAQVTGPESATLQPRPSPRNNQNGAQHPCSWGVRRGTCFPAMPSLKALPPSFLGSQSHPGRKSPIADPGAGGEGTVSWTKAPAGATHRASLKASCQGPSPPLQGEGAAGRWGDQAGLEDRGWGHAYSPG